MRFLHFIMGPIKANGKKKFSKKSVP
jgi:hypothetical protein